MKKYIKKIIGIISVVSVSVLIATFASAADELGEFCYSGAFQNTGDCFISIEATQHGKYFSLNGLSQCDVIEGKEWFSDVYSGIAYGSGHIKKDDNVFNGAMRVSSPTNSDMTPKTILFEINLDNLEVKFKAASDDSALCADGNDCILEYEFSSVDCQ
ncbi:MAG: hypothetical protein GQ583_05545 [Methyloprofundus sp.]|nr:hypothetical protein [Methyloprofundus sp.]